MKLGEESFRIVVVEDVWHCLKVHWLSRVFAFQFGAFSDDRFCFNTRVTIRIDTVNNILLRDLPDQIKELKKDQSLLVSKGFQVQQALARFHLEERNL